MPRSTREKSKTGICHVGLGRNQVPVPITHEWVTIFNTKDLYDSMFLSTFANSYRHI